MIDMKINTQQEVQGEDGRDLHLPLALPHGNTQSVRFVCSLDHQTLSIK